MLDAGGTSSVTIPADKLAQAAAEWRALKLMWPGPLEEQTQD